MRNKRVITAPNTKFLCFFCFLKFFFLSVSYRLFFLFISVFFVILLFLRSIKVLLYLPFFVPRPHAQHEESKVSNLEILELRTLILSFLLLFILRLVESSVIQKG